jgi:hypothetical protein
MGTGKRVVCTLTHRELGLRGGRWRHVLRRAATHVEPLPDGVAVRLACDDATRQTLRELMALEAACCQWMLLDLHDDAFGTTLTMKAESAEGVALIQKMAGRFA